jgi:ParB/RepB/Spo0J family partition protein
MTQPALKYVPLPQLMESQHNYRRSHDEARHLELVASIREHGVLTPLIVRQVTQDPDWMHEVAAGHRRLRAARAAGVVEVPVVVREMTDREFAEIMLTENLQRVDPDPLDEADAYQAMIADLEYDVATLAARFGKSETYIRQRLVLVNIAPEVRAALQAGTIELGHAVLLARTDATRQVKLLHEEILPAWKMSAAVTRSTLDDEDGEGTSTQVIDPARTRTTVGELRRIMARAFLPLAPVKWDRDDATLVPSAGSCTACPKRTGANPSLFEELDPADDRCQDEACYGAKRTAWLTARVSACRSQAPKLVAISTAYQRKLKSIDKLAVLRKGEEWESAKSGQRGTVPAIVVEISGADVSSWDGLGELRDVKLVKQAKASAPEARSASRSGMGASPELIVRHEAAEARFLDGLRGVVRALLVSPVLPADRRDALVERIASAPQAYFEMAHDVSQVYREVLLGRAPDADDEGDEDEEEDVAPRSLAQIDAMRVMSDEAARVCASLMLADIEVPYFSQWSNDPRDRPAIDESTGAYPIPPVLVELAAECDVDAVAVWTAAIEAEATEPAGVA